MQGQCSLNGRPPPGQPLGHTTRCTRATKEPQEPPLPRKNEEVLGSRSLHHKQRGLLLAPRLVSRCRLLSPPPAPPPQRRDEKAKAAADKDDPLPCLTPCRSTPTSTTPLCLLCPPWTAHTAWPDIWGNVRGGTTIWGRISTASSGPWAASQHSLSPSGYTAKYCGDGNYGGMTMC